MSAYDDAVAELEDTLRRLAPALALRDDGDAVLLSEWYLVLGTTSADDGSNRLKLVVPVGCLVSHSLGALRFAQLHTEASVLEDDR